MESEADLIAKAKFGGLKPKARLIVKVGMLVDRFGTWSDPCYFICICLGGMAQSAGSKVSRNCCFQPMPLEAVNLLTHLEDHFNIVPDAVAGVCMALRARLC
jgi:hypothetical protein